MSLDHARQNSTISDQFLAKLRDLSPEQRLPAIVLIKAATEPSEQQQTDLSRQELRRQALERVFEKARDLLPTIQADLNKIGCPIDSEADQSITAIPCVVVRVNREEAESISRLPWVNSIFENQTIQGGHDSAPRLSDAVILGRPPRALDAVEFELEAIPLQAHGAEAPLEPDGRAKGVSGPHVVGTVNGETLVWVLTSDDGALTFALEAPKAILRDDSAAVVGAFEAFAGEGQQ